jgi:hypothetical protein
MILIKICELFSVSFGDNNKQRIVASFAIWQTVRFYLWGVLKDELYSNNPHTSDVLHGSIRMYHCQLHLQNFDVHEQRVCAPKETTSRTFFKYRKNLILMIMYWIKTTQLLL